MPDDAVDDTVPVLWTGGWDSTFRLLDLVVAEGRTVRPYYALNRRRRSVPHELAARRAVRVAVRERWPDAADRILPSVIVDKDELADDPDLRASFRSLRDEHPMGDQYVYLALFARAVGVDGLELGFNAEDRPTLVLRPHLVPAARPTGATTTYRLRSDAPPGFAVFAPFAYPLVDLTKVAMEQRARAAGFLDVLELSWFCHDPVLDRPCGRCNPCVHTRLEGLPHRTPARVSTARGAALVRHAARRARHHAGRTRARILRRTRSVVGGRDPSR